MKIVIDEPSGLPIVTFGDIDDFKAVASLWTKFFPKKSEFLNYDPLWLKGFYDKVPQMESPDKKLFAPY